MRATERLLLVLLFVCLVLYVAGCTHGPDPTALSFVVEPVTAATLQFEAPFGWARYHWTFGDGRTGEGRTVSHTYDSPNEYSVSLKATALDGGLAFAHGTAIAHRDLHCPENGLLQGVVDAAEAGDWLFVEGDHAESVRVDKPITILGPCTLRPISGQDGAIGPAGSDEPALLIAADGVVLRDIAFRAGSNSQPSRGVLRIVSATVSVLGCSFEGIVGAVGSAVHMTDSDGRFDDCSFTKNEASIDGGAVYSIESKPQFADCVFADNEADLGGGAVYCEGDTAFPAFERCTFLRNRADAGGAILIRAATVVRIDATPLRVEGCTFLENLALGGFSGGAIHVGDTARTVLNDNTFSGNGPHDVVFE